MTLSHPRHGFTLIELLVVFSIVTGLASMSAVGVARSLQRSALTSSMGAIRDLASSAQLLAIRSPFGSTTTYGVVVGFDATHSRYYAALIHGGPGDGRARHSDRQLGDQRRLLSPNAVVMLAGEDLAADAEIAWYFQPGTGLPLRCEGNRFSCPGATVGLAAVAFTDGEGRPLFGANHAPTPATIAPATAEFPGLAVVSRDHRIRYALAVYATGTIFSGEF